MLLEVDGGREPLGALFAGESALHRVGSGVQFEMEGDAERLATDLANVRSFASMYRQVPLEQRLLEERATTDVACMRASGEMRLLVLAHVGEARESASTDLALVRPGAGMYAHVLLKAVVGEMRVADVTDKRLLAGVSATVAREPAEMDEDTATFVADVAMRLFCVRCYCRLVTRHSVTLPVDSEVRGELECLATDRADMVGGGSMRQDVLA